MNHWRLYSRLRGHATQDYVQKYVLSSPFNIMFSSEIGNVLEHQRKKIEIKIKLDGEFKNILDYKCRGAANLTPFKWSHFQAGLIWWDTPFNSH